MKFSRKTNTPRSYFIPPQAKLPPRKVSNPKVATRKSSCPPPQVNFTIRLWYRKKNRQHEKYFPSRKNSSRFSHVENFVMPALSLFFTHENYIPQCNPRQRITLIPDESNARKQCKPSLVGSLRNNKPPAKYQHKKNVPPTKIRPLFMLIHFVKVL